MFGFPRPERAAYVEAERTAALSINNDTSTPVTFTEVYDPEGMFTSDGSDFTVPPGFAGLWLPSVRVEYAASATGVRETFIYDNTSGRFFDDRGPAASAGVHYSNVSGVFRFVEGDTFTVYAKQTSGGALNVSSAWLSAVFLGPA